MIETLSSGGASSHGESVTYTVDYDTVAQTIGLTCTGSGHALLDVVDFATGQDLGSIWADQFGATAGPLTNGQSASAVSYDGQRHVVLGPGASGVQSNGQPLPTAPVSSAVVGQFDVPKGQTPTLSIGLHWSP